MDDMLPSWSYVALLLLFEFNVPQYYGVAYRFLVNIYRLFSKNYG